MLKGYVINEDRVIVTKDNHLSLVESINNEMNYFNNRLINVENKINSKELPLEVSFYNGEVYDAYSLIQNIFNRVNIKIIIINNYIDDSILDRLKYKNKEVNVIIYTNIKKSKLLDSSLAKYKEQYGNIEVLNIEHMHDRFIIIDNNELYHLGASIKDAGKKVFAISKMDSNLINYLLSTL